MDYKPITKPIFLIPQRKKPINIDQVNSNSFSGAYTYKFITNPNQTSNSNSATINNKIQNYSPKIVTHGNTNYFRDRGISERLSINNSCRPIIKPNTQNYTNITSDARNIYRNASFSNIVLKNDGFKKNDKNDSQSIKPQNYHSLIILSKNDQTDNFTEENHDFSTLSIESNSEKKELFKDKEVQQCKQKQLLQSCKESTMMKNLNLQGCEKCSKLEKDYRELVDKFNKLQNGGSNKDNLIKKTDSNQLLNANGENLINLRNQNLRIDQSLRISRNIISNLSQKIKKMQNLHEVKINIVQEQHKKVILELKKKKQDQQVMTNKQIINFGVSLKLLEKNNFELKLKIIDEANHHQQKIKQLQSLLSNKHQSEKTILLEEIKRLSDKYVNQQNKKQYALYQTQNQKLRNCLAKAEEQAQYLNGENKHLMEKNIQLNKKYIELNQLASISSERIQILKVQIHQMSLLMQNKQKIIYQQNLEQKGLLNQIVKINQSTIFKQQQLNIVKMQKKSKEEEYQQQRFNKNKQIQILSEQIIQLNQLFQSIKQQKQQLQKRIRVESQGAKSIMEQSIINLTQKIQKTEAQPKEPTKLKQQDIALSSDGNTKKNQYNLIEDKTDVIIMDKLNQLQSLVETNKNLINYLEQQNVCLKNKNQQLIQKYQFLQLKYQWLQTVEKTLDIHLHETTQDLLKMQAQFVNFKMQARQQKQRLIQFLRGNYQYGQQNQNIQLNFQSNSKNSIFNEETIYLLDQCDQHLMIKSSELLKESCTLLELNEPRSSKSLLELNIQTYQNKTNGEKLEQSQTSKDTTHSSMSCKQINKQNKAKKYRFLEILSIDLQKLSKQQKNKIAQKSHLQYGNLVLLNGNQNRQCNGLVQ